MKFQNEKKPVVCDIMSVETPALSRFLATAILACFSPSAVFVADEASAADFST